MNILIFIIVLLVLVLSHEFGHFIVAKKAGIRVDEFSFGFPPRLFGKKIGETTYSVNLLPLGGYVKIYGENPDEDSMNGPDSKRSFVNKPKYIQALVLISGVLMNLIVAWLLLSFGFMSGLPTSLSAVPNGYSIDNHNLTVTSVLKNSPADKGGIKSGDVIVMMESGSDQTPSLSSSTGPTEVQNFIKSHGDKEVKVSIVRGSEFKQISIVPSLGTNGNPVVGISMDIVGKLKLPVHLAFFEGLKLTGDVFYGTIVGFFSLIRDAFLGYANMSSLTGPVGIVGIIGDAASFGFVYLLSFTALISINLAVINLIPFPALDGGRLLFLIIEKIKGSRIKPQVGNLINAIGFIILMLLMVIITYHDIIKLL